MKRTRRSALRMACTLICMVPASLVLAAPPVLRLPITCRLGDTCYIQNFYDHDPGPEYHDYTCGHLTYDGHRGTDFALPTLKMMEQGVNVLAAASGTVVAVRDGEPDVSIRERGTAALDGKDAGNGVRIRHQEGWETQYSHMKHESIVVRAGDRVQAGQILGQVGLSGNTEFPHLHFSLRYQGRDIDPFAPKSGPCGSSQHVLWSAELKKSMQYKPTGLLQAGFSTEIPERSRVDNETYDKQFIKNNAPALIFWSVVYGIQKGDQVELRLYDTSGRPLYQKKSKATKNQAMLFAYAGKRRSGAMWPLGRYRGRVLLRRDQSVVLDTTRVITIEAR